jgi:ABC-type glycerol-3-phosphate transport system permease component
MTALPRRSRRVAPGGLAAYAILTVAGLVLAAPVVWVVMAAFMPSQELAKYPPNILPGGFTLANFEQVFRLAPMTTFLLNSLGVAACVTLLATATSLFAGYIFSVIEWPGREVAFWCVVVTLFTPFQVLVVPLFVLMKNLHSVDSYQALVLPFIVSAFGVMLVRSAFMNTPQEYFDAARVDGLSEWRIVWRIAFPLVRPAMSALAIFTFLGQWDSLLWPAVVISSQNRFTLPLGITTLSTSYVSSPSITVAAAVIALVPTVVVFGVFQRRFIEGAALSGLR